MHCAGIPSDVIINSTANCAVGISPGIIEHRVNGIFIRNYTVEYQHVKLRDEVKMMKAEILS